jgi:AraC-like DNA-binding protein
VYETASRCGYKSDAAFSRAFKRAVGMPPGEYRRTTSQAGSNLDPSRDDH